MSHTTWEWSQTISMKLLWASCVYLLSSNATRPIISSPNPGDGSVYVYFGQIFSIYALLLWVLRFIYISIKGIISNDVGCESVYDIGIGHSCLVGPTLRTTCRFCSQLHKISSPHRCRGGLYHASDNAATQLYREALTDFHLSDRIRIPTRNICVLEETSQDHQGADWLSMTTLVDLGDWTNRMQIVPSSATNDSWERCKCLNPIMIRRTDGSE